MNDEYHLLAWSAWIFPAIMAAAFLLAGAILFMLGFFLDRSRGPQSGHCACGYELTGNVSGVCPECGLASGASQP